MKNKIVTSAQPGEPNLIIELMRFVLITCIMLLHIFSFSYDTTVKPFLHYNYIADFFFVLSGVVLYDFYMREFAHKRIKDSNYIKFFRKRFKRFFPVLFISLVLSTLLFLAEKIAYNLMDKPLNVFPERSLSGAIVMLLFFQFIYLPAFFILPNAWGVSVEFLGNIILMFKPFIKNNYGLLSLAIIGILFMELGLKYELQFEGLNYGTNGLPALGRAIVGLAAGFLVKRNAGKLEKIYSPKLFFLVVVVFFLGFRWPLHDLTTNPLAMDLLFGIIMIYLIKWNFSKNSAIGKLSFVGGGISYPFYLFHGVVLDLVNYMLNMPDDFSKKYPESISSVSIRIVATFTLTCLISYFIENIIRRYGKGKSFGKILTFKNT